MTPVYSSTLRPPGRPVAELNSEPREGGAMLYAILVGLIAGWLAGQVMKGGGYGILIDILLGLVGGLIGGWLFGALGIYPGGGVIGSIIVAFVGAVILVALTRVIRRA